MIIAIANHKGGTGKTTTAVNLAFALKNTGKKILLVDADPQGNMTYSLGVHQPEFTIADVMGGKSVNEVVVHVRGIDLLPSGIALYAKEDGFFHTRNKYFLLHKALRNHGYDIVLADCPPSFSLYTLNVLCAADKVLIPVQLDVLSIQGLKQMLEVINEVKSEANAELEVLGVVAVNVDERRHLTYEVLEHIQETYDVLVFHNYIRSNVKAAEAPSFSMSVVEYASKSNSALDYMAVSNEFLKYTQN
jgi:chromosome partitioning protein